MSEPRTGEEFGEVLSLRDEIKAIFGLVLEKQPYRLILADSLEPGKEYDELRCASVRMQQKLATLIVRFSQNRQRREKARGLWRQFWSSYGAIALANPEIKDSDVNKDIIARQRGVRGMVAVWLMAERARYGVILPDPVHDVKSDVDLIIDRHGQRIPLSIKCQAQGEWKVKKDPESHLVLVIVPDRSFLDPEIGVPHKNRYEKLVKGLDDQVPKRK